MGETWKFLKGGVEIGPMVCPFETSSFKFAETTSGFKKAVGKLFEKHGYLGPEYPILAPSLSSEHSLLTNSLSG